MKKKYEELKRELEKKMVFELERKKRIEQPGNEKERRSVGRRVGGMVFFVGFILGLVQFLAYTFDGMFYLKLSLFSGVAMVFGLAMIVTGWMPKTK